MFKKIHEYTIEPIKSYTPKIFQFANTNYTKKFAENLNTYLGTNSTSRNGSNVNNSYKNIDISSRNGSNVNKSFKKSPSRNVSVSRRNVIPVKNTQEYNIELSVLYDFLANSSNYMRKIEQCHNEKYEGVINKLKKKNPNLNGYDILKKILDEYNNNNTTNINFNISNDEILINNIIYIFNKNVTIATLKGIIEIKFLRDSINTTLIGNNLDGSNGCYYALNLFFNDRDKANTIKQHAIGSIMKLRGESNIESINLFNISKTFRLSGSIPDNTLQQKVKSGNFSDLFKYNYAAACKILNKGNIVFPHKNPDNDYFITCSNFIKELSN